MTLQRSARFAAGLFLCLATAQACGPDFYVDVFVRKSGPDLPARFVQGHLGLLQPEFARGDLFVAYHYFNGGNLDPAEQKAWTPTYSEAEADVSKPDNLAQRPDEPDTSLERWVAARAQYADAPSAEIHQEASIKVHLQGGYEYEQNYLNCANDAFRVATATLLARAAQWDKTSPALLDWLHGQDTVFADCGGGTAIPAAAPAGGSALLQQDRSYQIAAAQFYAHDFASAAASFRAISEDRTSPWQPGGGYLAARALIRQAFFAKPSTGDTAKYDPALMKAAEDQLRAYLTGDPPPGWRKAAEDKLAFISIRLHSEERAQELGKLVSGPAHDPHYDQDLIDLLWIANAQTPEGLRSQVQPGSMISNGAEGTHAASRAEAEALSTDKRTKAYDATASLRAAVPIVDWAITVQALAPSASAHALQQWHATHSRAWLTAALMLAPNGTKGMDDLLTSAASIPESAPAWQTITYHRARLLLAGGHAPEARAVLNGFSDRLQAIPAARREPSTVNAARGLQALAATSISDFLAFAPQTLLVQGSEEGSSVDECRTVMMNNHNRHYDCVNKVDPEQLESSVAQVFNTSAPLSLWVAAAHATTLSGQVRQAIAQEGWTRAQLLGDQAATAALLPLLPAKLQEEAKQPTPLNPWITIARNPGLRPYLNAGVQRAYSYDFVESYRDNWCYLAAAQSSPAWAQPGFAPEQPAPAFLDAAAVQHGQQEARKLADIRSLYVGQQIVRAVQANTGDPQAAEALYLVLRMIRYGCVEPAQPPPPPGKPNPFAGLITTQEAKDLLQLKQDASRLLRRYYASSPWTKEAAPFAG